MPNLLWITLIACTPDEGWSFVSPLDGQAEWPVDEPLQLHLTEAPVPRGYPLPAELLRVVDLDGSGFVEGHAEQSASDVLFVPRDGWTPGHRYAWSVGRPPNQAREVELALPENVLGEGVFDTSDSLELLEAGNGDGDLCLLFSRALRSSEVEIVVSVNEAPAVVVVAEPFEAAIDLDLELGPIGPEVGASCVDLSISEGALVRVWVDDGGPWQVQATADLSDTIRSRRRAARVGP